MYCLEQKHEQVILYITSILLSKINKLKLEIFHFLYYLQYLKSINLDNLINRSLKLLIEKKTLDILVLLLPKLKTFWLSNISILSVPDANYSRNVQCALNLMVFITYIIYYVYYNYEQEIPSNTESFSKKKISNLYLQNFKYSVFFIIPSKGLCIENVIYIFFKLFMEKTIGYFRCVMYFLEQEKLSNIDILKK